MTTSYTGRDGLMFLAGLMLAMGVFVAYIGPWWLGLPCVVACLVFLLLAANTAARKPPKGVVWLMPPFGDDEFDDAPSEEEEATDEPLPSSMNIGSGLFSSPDEGSSPE